HLVQAYQVYVLKWPVHEARGVLGQVFPWLVHSEVLHYGYAVIMLAGIWALLPGFAGRSRAWWLAALALHCWPRVEPALLPGEGRRPASVGRSSVRTPAPHCGEGTGGAGPKG